MPYLLEMKQKAEAAEAEAMESSQEDFKYEFDPPEFLENFSKISKKKKKKKKGMKHVSNILNPKPGKIKKRKHAPGKKCVGRPRKDRPDDVIEDAKLFPYVKTGEDKRQG